MRRVLTCPYYCTHSLIQPVQAKTLFATVTLDLEFKRRLPKEGLRIAHVRQVVKKLQEGRMDLESIIRDENEELAAVSPQICFVLDAQKFKKSGGSEKANFVVKVTLHDVFIIQIILIHFILL